MKAFILAVLFFASPAFASYASHECSSPEGYYRYSFFWAWDTPEAKRWWLNGQETIASSVRETADRIVVERWSDQMQERTVYAVKLEATFPDTTWEGYVLCRSAGGI